MTGNQLTKKLFLDQIQNGLSGLGAISTELKKVEIFTRVSPYGSITMQYKEVRPLKFNRTEKQFWPFFCVPHC